MIFKLTGHFLAAQILRSFANVEELLLAAVRGQSCHRDNSNLVFYCESFHTVPVMFIIAIA